MATTSSREAVATPVITASSAYTSGYVVGAPFKLSNMFGLAQSGVILSAWLNMKTAQTAEFDLYLFDAQPSGTFGDKAAPVIAAADVPHLRGKIAFATALSDLGANHTRYEADNIGKAMGPGVRDLWGVLIVKGTPTFGSTSDITVGVASLADV